ncbi:HAMP domain-containing protein [Brevibacillus brevis]|uniref:histidine kinase n=1 Tax=Brevibacillus brevis TaxID=1393 RepID=A0A2Z4MKU1_BREBE|nr:HAMP domain-containing sensor histidine kinase [Brevibacillus brevis]AWX57122.1 HAMP domain-containing protein [Brevibacillus brevis]
MKFHWKIFLTMTSTVVGISIIFITLTHLIVKNAIDAGINETRGKEVGLLTNKLSNYYLDNKYSWDKLQQFNLLQDIHQENPSIIVMDSNQNVICYLGDSPETLITHLGIHKEIMINEQIVGQFFYYDPEVANLNKIMIGIPISVVIILLVSGALLILISLIITYQLSRWLASPLRALLPVIEQLGKGEFGVQTNVNTHDEYGKIANAINVMSTKLEQAEKARQNLTADVAHELRTPLTIIGGKLDSLQQQGKMIPPETLLPLQDELIRLNQLVEDLRTLSLAEAGELPLKKEPTNMADLAKKLLAAMEQIAEEKGISIQLDVLTNQTTISADANRIKQVLVNLLTNAIRFTPSPGAIYLRLFNENDQYLTVIVQDTGIGISPEHLPHLFDRFYRVDEARSRVSGGTGLGLAIAKQYVLSHNGILEVQSNLNQGSRFIIRLPY